TKVPLGGDGGHLLFHKTNRQQTACLEVVGRKVILPGKLCHLLKLPNSFVQQSHFPESHTQIVMGFGIVLGGLGGGGFFHVRKQADELRGALAGTAGGRGRRQWQWGDRWRPCCVRGQLL